MRKRWFITGVVGLLAVVTSGTAALWPRRPTASRWQFLQIQRGMSRPEVVAIHGGLPGDHTTRPHLPVSDGEGYTVWVGDEGTVFIRFDEARRVGKAYFMETLPCSTPPTGPSLFQMLRAWLRL